jgi:hypothetical protein
MADLAVLEAFNKLLFILKGDGSGGFVVSEVRATPEPTGNPIAQDVNGDGLSDLGWVLGLSAGSIVLSPGQTSGPGPEETFLLPPEVAGRYFLAAGDFNGDGKIDLLTANKGSNNVSRLLGKSPNQAPVSDAGTDLTGLVGEIVRLNGNGSYDPDGDAIGFNWVLSVQPPGSTASLTDPMTPTPSLLPDLPGTYGIALTVDDGDLTSKSDTVNVTVLGASQIIEAIRVAIGDAPPADFKSGGSNSLARVLDDVETLLTRANVGAAIKKIQDLRMHVDGCVNAGGTADRNDWVIGCGMQIEIRRLVDGLIRTLTAPN